MHNKGNYKQGEKTALRLGENNSKRSNRQRINLKNTQPTPPAQLQKNKVIFKRYTNTFYLGMILKSARLLIYIAGKDFGAAAP